MKQAFNSVKAIIEKQQIKMNDKMIEKSDLTKIETNIKKWSKQLFADREGYEKINKKFKD